LFIFTLAVGTATVGAISLSPLYARRLRVVRSSRLGAALVAGAIAVGVASVAGSGRPLPPTDELFLCLFALLLMGALLLLGDDPDEHGDDEDGRGEDSDGDPPWWPEFEAGFRGYARRPRSPVASR
jgi:hypothetical protein